MFCPQCKTEYRQGFWKCADCDVDLVYELPPEPREPLKPQTRHVDFIEVFSTDNTADMTFITSMLDSKDIAYLVKGGGSPFFGLHSFPARLMVEKGQVKQVQELLDEIELVYEVDLSEDAE